MDNSWLVKCGSTLQSSMPMPSAAQEPRNQMEINSGHFFHPHFGLDLRSQVHGRTPDPTFPNIPNLSSYSLGQADLGNSFLALLSGPASLLQCDFQELSNPKPFYTSSKLPIEGGTIAVSAIGSRNPLTSSGLLSENVSYQNLRNGVGVCPVVSPRETASSNSDRNSVLQYGLQAAKFNFQSSDLAKAAVHRMVPGNENMKDFPPLRAEWACTTPPNSVKLQDTNSQLPQKMPLETESSVSNNSSTFTSGSPRVFCSGTSGNLLLSNTGLLGILCSCHCFHMSISKFCEHSGLWNVNPGDAVRMESGETIAQWRKLYFQKFGIRVPEDQSGWDWREGLSLTASLVKSSVHMPMSKNSDCNHLVGPSGGLVRSRQPIDSPVFPKKSVAGQNSVIDALHDKQQRNSQDGIKFLGLVGTLQSNSRGVGDDQLTDCHISRCLTRPQFVSGPENGCQSISACIEDIVKTGSLPTTNHTLQNLRAILNSFDVSRAEDEKVGVIVDKDTASSSIELRLGQPKQQSQKLYSQEQMIHYVTNCGGERGAEESRQCLPCGAGLSNSVTRREPIQLNCGHLAISNAMDVAKIDKLKGDMPKTSVVSPFRHFNAPPEGNSHSKVTNNVVIMSEHIIPETPHRESHAVKCNPVNIPWNGGNGLERLWTVPEFSFFTPTDKGKGVGSLNDNSYTETGSGFKMHNWMENPSSFVGVVGGNSYSGFPAIHDTKHCSHHLSSTPPYTSDAGSLSNYVEKVGCFGSNGHIDHVFLRSMGSTVGSEQSLPSQAVPLGFPSSTSTSIQGLTPGLLKQESIGASPYLLDDNLRLLALSQILELSKQQKVMSSLGKNLEQRRCDNSTNVKAQHSLVEPSGSGEQRHGPNLTGKQDVFDVSVKSIQPGPTSQMGNDVDKCTRLTGLNNWCNFSPLTRGMPLHCKEIDMRCQLSHDPIRNEQPSLRLGGSENSITHLNEHESCCQMTHYFQGYCSCAAHTNCLGGQCKLKAGNPSNLFGQQIGGVNGRTPMSIASQFVKDHIVPKETTTSLDQCGKLKGQLPKNISCHASHWKDVPSKVKRACEVARMKQSADVLDERGHEMDKCRDTTVRCSNGAVHMADSFKEQETSNISSGCSTPAVTQASVEVNNMDSSTVDAGNAVYVNNLVVDEGSGIDKCSSSDGALESDRSADFCGSTCKTSLREDGSFKMINNQSSRSLLDEVKLIDSLTWKRGRNQIHSVISVHEKTNCSQESERVSKTGKRKREMKLNMLDTSLGTRGPAVCDKYPECDGTAECLSKDVQMISSGRETSTSGIRSIKPSSKRGKSTLSLAQPISRKRDLHRLYIKRDGEDDYKTDLNNDVNSYKILKVAGRKKFKSSGASDACTQFRLQEPTHAAGEKIVDYDSVSYMKASSSRQENVCYRKVRPIVCGKYGEISNGKMAGDVSKPVKIVSLDRVLKTARRCTPPKNCKPRLNFKKDLKITNFSWSNLCLDKFANLKKENGSNDALVSEEMNLHNSVKKRENASAGGDKQSAHAFSMLEKDRCDKSGKYCSILDTNPHTRSEPKFKEIRRRSLYELTLKGKNSSSEMPSHKNIFKCAPETKVGKILKNCEDSKCHIRGSRNINTKRYIQEQKHLSITDSDSFCCVCGSSNKDELNCLLECGRCLIKVHQACYGVSKVPKSHWYCRPCRTSSKNIVCVLCGYGGGAMTRALRSRTIVKSLLKAWSFETECKPKNAISSAGTLHDEFSVLHSLGSVLENNSYPILRPVNIEPSTSAVWNMDLEKQLDILQNSLCCASNLKVRNSITAGVLDSTIKQWVHMVCGLWTPGTRCPNVDTMSAFDVSGASHPRANMVCSICNRPGGSCIQCRVVNCSVQFHPWCAHQKGLLQSELEGVDNENVGFYGRCVLHATYPTDESACDANNIGKSCPGENEESCARTEGYKGRKRDGFWHNLHGQSKGKGGCLVPQEQLNAWIHINGQKSCTQGLSKLPVSDMEYDCRKEYARYKQAKGWKHLVVYKSGIHALGLYTSRFISRSEMVVEYVGEIVGLRVSDKRENEYQSGRKLQYKSACYFFRIDKEHIIDATRKGGIARFVNHSCLPNCVAKVISVRNEKKVVFFAERDIYPGEEITYDYHFNHEDEGKKIPCFCNSKNCRRYLN